MMKRAVVSVLIVGLCFVGFDVSSAHGVDYPPTPEQEQQLQQKALSDFAYAFGRILVPPTKAADKAAVKAAEKSAAKSLVVIDITKPVTHSLQTIAPHAPNTDQTKLGAVAAFHLTLNIDGAAACGKTGAATEFCAPGVTGALAPGKYDVVAGFLAGPPFPTTDMTNRLTYSLLFDRDGNTTNNYSSAMYRYDTWTNADTVFMMQQNKGVPPAFSVTDATNNGRAPRASAARFVTATNMFLWIVPAQEVPHDNYRLTTFEDSGDFGLQGGPWSAGNDPLSVDDPLNAITGPVIVIGKAPKNAPTH
jgi:hypothetical protein